MRLSYNLIKSDFAEVGESKIISTEYSMNTLVDNNFMEEEQEKKVDVNPEEILKKYHEIGERIVANAESEKQAILLRVQKEAEAAEKRAYEEGYKQGLQNGYDDGYKKAYEETIEKSQAEAENIVNNAESLLKSANENYAQYLQSKRAEIINLALDIAEAVTKKSLSEDSGMNSLIEEALKISKDEETIILRVNSVHIDEIKAQSERWKLSYGIKNDLFIINDDSMEAGNVIIEKPSGIVKVGVDIGMEQIRKVILGQD